MMLYLGLLFVWSFKLSATTQISEQEGDILWTKSSRPLVLTCRGIKDMTWYKDDTTVDGNDVVSVFRSKTFNGSIEHHVTKVMIDRARNIDSGNYSCGNGRQRSYIDVRVVKGNLKVHPSGKITTFVGDPFTMSCNYEGDMKIDVMWFKDGEKKLANNGFVTSKQTFSNSRVKTLIMTTKSSMEVLDSGSYFCRAGPYVKVMSVDVLKDKCGEPLVSGPNVIHDDNITASSYYRDIMHNDSPRCARLNQTDCGGWSPIKNNIKQWIQVSFGSPKVIRSIVTSGLLSKDSRQHWIESYRLLYSHDGITWYKYKDIQGHILELEANFDKTTHVTSKLPVPAVASYFRLQPTRWHGSIGLRFEMIGCSLPSTIHITSQRSGKLNLTIPGYLKIECNYTGGSKPDIVWYKDGIRLLGSSGFTQRINTTWMSDRVISSAELIKHKTDYQDSGVYTCVDRTSKQNKSVTVDATKLEMQPALKRIWFISGSSLQISCETTGRDAKDITWSGSKGKPLKTTGYYITTKRNASHRTFKTLSTISKDRLTKYDTSKISCSDGVTVRKVDIVVISGKGNSVVLQPGHNLSLQCEVGEVNERYSFEVYWTKDYIPINLLQLESAKYDYISDARSLSIYHADSNDAGHYECNILMEVGTKQQQHLTIPFSIIAQPTAIITGGENVKISDTLHLYCKISGYPVPKVTWYKDGGEITNESPRYNFMAFDKVPDAHFLKFDVTKNDQGEYACRASSAQFEPVTSSKFIQIKEEPFYKDLLMITVVVASAIVIVTIICCVACIRCRRDKPGTRNISIAEKVTRVELPHQNKPLLLKRYVDLEVSTQNKSLTSLEEIDRLPLPPPPSDPWDETSTLEDISLTYERIPKIRGSPTV